MPSDDPQLLIHPADLAEPDDARALLRLLDAYAADPMGAGRPLAPAVRERLIPALQQVRHRVVLLARVLPQRRAVGAAVAFIGFSTFRARGLLNVHDLTVRPEWRGRGIGRRLMLGLETIARERGLCKLTLEVRADNPAARALYGSLGFGAGSSDEGAVQYLFLEKRLSGADASEGAAVEAEQVPRR